MSAVPSIGHAPSTAPRSVDETTDLYEQYSRQIFAFCFRELGNNREEAEDATQSTFLNAFRALERGTEVEHESAWLYQIAHHVCQTRKRSWYRRRRIETDGDFDTLQHVLASPVNDSDELFGLKPALEALPEQQRKALLLREWQGLSYAEIATQLDLSQSAVETLLFRARRGLASELTDTPIDPRRLRKVGNTGDFGSLAAAIKALFVSGGVKVAATLATVAATTVVASTPQVRDDVVHFVAPALPHAASVVKHPTKATTPKAAADVPRHTVVSTPAVSTKHAVAAPRTHVVAHAKKVFASTKAGAALGVVAPTTVAATAASRDKPSDTPSDTRASAPTSAPAANDVTVSTPTAPPLVSTTTPTATTPVTSDTPGGRSGGDSSAQGAPAPIAPTFSGFTPSGGPVGTLVSIVGAHLSGVTSVRFNGTPAAFGNAVDSQLVARVPDGATSGPITVTTKAGTSTTTSDFTVTAGSVSPAAAVAPTVSGFSPSSGSPGASITITGSHLGGQVTVRLNGASAGIVSASDSQLVVKVPENASSGAVTVNNGAGTANAGMFTVVFLPYAGGFTPSSGLAGASVTVLGAHLNGATAVKFNGIAATFTPGTDGQLTAKVPDGATTGPITVTTAQGSSTTNGSFKVIAPPTVSSLSPTSGVLNQTVTIAGTQLGTTSSVSFNGVSVGPQSVSDNQITVRVPTSATSGPVTVTTPAGTVSAGSFVVLPSLYGTSPGSAAVGATVTISGARLTGATAVKFNGMSATFSVVSDTQITAQVPAGATNGQIQVTTPSGIATTSSSFTVNAPVLPSISSLSPGSGVAGSYVTITGAHLTAATSVKFNGVSASFVINSETQITAAVPASATSGTVTVTTASGTATSSTSFTVTH